MQGRASESTSKGQVKTRVHAGLDLGQGHPAWRTLSGLAVLDPQNVTIISDMLSGNYSNKEEMQGSLSRELGVGESRQGLRCGPQQRPRWPRTSISPFEELIQQ